MTEVHGLSEKRFEALIGLLLRTGVALAASVVLAGGIFYLTKYGGVKPDYSIFRGEPSDLRSIGGVVGGHDFAAFAGNYSAWAAATDCNAHRACGIFRGGICVGARLALRGNYLGGARGADLQFIEQLRKCFTSDFKGTK